MQQLFVPKLEERFIRYVQIDTQSDEQNAGVPSTAKQFDLLRPLADELRALGAADVCLTADGFVMATIPATIPANDVPTVAFLAHVDTAPAFSGTAVKPIIHRQYDGRPITLPDDPTQVLHAANSPELAGKIGEDVVTASGLTLLGADDKAGIAIIMTLAEHLLANPEIPHGRIRICFTPDEEIGRGVGHLNLDDLVADVAYTLDGGDVGEVTYETFSADKAVVKISGVSTHPGTAKNVLVNALTLASNLIQRLPQDSHTPETTSGREGFIFLHKLQGTAAAAELQFILRDFEVEGLQVYGDQIRAAAQHIQAAEPRAQIDVAITPQYRNMRYWLEQDKTPVDMAVRAVERAGIPLIIRPIRGGTDGSWLTAKGLPTPNLFTGMHNCHGPLEWVTLQDMARATEMCVHLAQIWAEPRPA
ncbi:MAG: peptidase T [Chloroflexi bacterium]|nr:peptidase T [Chloroflexota bacterium]